jgi:hypothetical protein
MNGPAEIVQAGVNQRNPPKVITELIAKGQAGAPTGPGLRQTEHGRPWQHR